MGYIERAAGIPDFSKGVISIWFNVPAASIAAATTAWEEWNDGDQVDGDLIGVIPLMTFGPNTETASFAEDIGDLSPCVIGILCDNGGPHMYARFQYDTGSQGYPIDYNDFFQVGGRVGTGVSAGSGTPQYISVTADTWHHILISFDFSGGCATDWDEAFTVDFNTICPFYWAFDDVNYTGNYLHPNTPSMFGQAAAAGIVSDLCIAVTDPEADPPGPFPSSHAFAADEITTSGKPFGVPASSDRSDHIYIVRMSEGKLFTGVTLDTSVEENRRAFVTSFGSPAAPVLATALLGKEPEIYFQTHTDFITGNNRGTEGDFTPTGTIIPYSPGP